MKETTLWKCDICGTEYTRQWDFGPVIPEVYRRYKQFGSTDIQIRFRSLEEIQKGFEREDRKRIEEVVDRFADFSAADLTILTQNQAPWNEAFGRKEKVIRCEDILEYFS